MKKHKKRTSKQYKTNNIKNTQENSTLNMCFYVCPMCVLDKCEICQKICDSALTFQAHNEKFHTMKNSTNHIFYKCDQYTKTFKEKNKFPILNYVFLCVSYVCLR